MRSEGKKSYPVQMFMLVTKLTHFKLINMVENKGKNIWLKSAALLSLPSLKTARSSKG